MAELPERLLRSEMKEFPDMTGSKLPRMPPPPLLKRIMLDICRLPDRSKPCMLVEPLRPASPSCAEFRPPGSLFPPKKATPSPR